MESHRNYKRIYIQPLFRNQAAVELVWGSNALKPSYVLVKDYQKNQYIYIR